MVKMRASVLNAIEIPPLTPVTRSFSSSYLHQPPPHIKLTEQPSPKLHEILLNLRPPSSFTLLCTQPLIILDLIPNTHTLMQHRMLRQLAIWQRQLNALRPLIAREVRAMSSARDISSNDHAILVRLDLGVVVAVWEGEVALAGDPDKNPMTIVSTLAGSI